MKYALLTAVLVGFTFVAQGLIASKPAHAIDLGQGNDYVTCTLVHNGTVVTTKIVELGQSCPAAEPHNYSKTTTVWAGVMHAIIHDNEGDTGCTFHVFRS